MMHLCSLVSQLSNYDRCQLVCFCIQIQASFLLTNQCVVLAEINGFYVRD